MSAVPATVVDESSRLAHLLALRDIAERAAAIDLEAADANRGSTAQVAGAMRRLLEQALEVMEAVQGSDDEPAAAGDLVEPDAWVSSAPSIRAIPRVGDVCFAGAMELRRVLRELGTAPDDDGRLVAAETGRRKLRRAIRAVLETAGQVGESGAPGGHHGPYLVADVASALAIRRLYARFRRSLRRPTEETPEAVLAAVRYAGGALAALVADPDYADVRASDRAVLRKLRERALQWARHDRGVATGVHLLDDVWTCGDLLRGINRRQELKDHDGALIPRLLRGPDDDVGAWFAQLDALYGLDDDLDQLFDRARAIAKAGGALDRLVPEVLIHLGQVR
jgi:hypothetical protein